MAPRVSSALKWCLDEKQRIIDEKEEAANAALIPVNEEPVNEELDEEDDHEDEDEEEEDQEEGVLELLEENHRSDENPIPMKVLKPSYLLQSLSSLIERKSK